MTQLDEAATALDLNGSVHEKNTRVVATLIRAALVHRPTIIAEDAHDALLFFTKNVGTKWGKLGERIRHTLEG